MKTAAMQEQLRDSASLCHSQELKITYSPADMQPLPKTRLSSLYSHPATMESLKRSRRIQDKEDKEAKDAKELALQKRVKLEESAIPGASNCFVDPCGSSAPGFSSFAAKSSSQPRRVYGSTKSAHGKAKCKTEAKGEHTD
jgi:hypothetical protein